MEISPHCTNSPWNLAEHNVFCNTSIHGPQAGACEAVVRFCGEKCQDDGAIHQRRCWPSQQGNRLIEEPGHPSGELLTCTCMPGLLVCNCIPESCCCVQAGGGVFCGWWPLHSCSRQRQWVALVMMRQLCGGLATQTAADHTGLTHCPPCVLHRLAGACAAAAAGACHTAQGV